MVSNKYGNKRVESDGIWFDSVLERNVYLSLLLSFDRSDIKVHDSIHIADKNEFFAAWGWKCDFYIVPLDLYIEAKGVRTDAWKEKLHAISVIKPDILKRLIVVSAKSGEHVCKGIKTITIAELNGRFRDISIAKAQKEFREKERC